MPLFKKTLTLPYSVEKVFEWHERKGALERMLPPWDEIQVLEQTGSIRNGDEVRLSIPFGPLHFKWIARHCNFKQNQEFSDEQVEGPFKHWLHRHQFSSVSKDQTTLTDEIAYEAPLGELGAAVGSGFFERSLEQTFAYRHSTLRSDLYFHNRKGIDRPKVLITGATGLVGSALCAFFLSGGYEVRTLGRKDLAQKRLDSNAFEGLDAVIHLAGENIAAKRWTPEIKEGLRQSRLETTKRITTAIEAAKVKPKLFIAASAIGFYGNRGEEFLTETESQGSGFLADLCRDWEKASQNVSMRAVQLRIGMVLSPRGGALKKLLTPFRMGVGGPIGDGQNWMSWITVDDLIYLISHCIHHQEINGPLNAAAPEAMRNEDFSRTLARVLGRPLGPRVPTWVIKTVAGELANELLLASIRVSSSKAETSGFQFSQPSLEGALRHLLGKREPA